MNGKTHLTVAFIVFVLIELFDWIFGKDLFKFGNLIVIFFTQFPDLDKTSKIGHRSFLTHSLIIPSLMLFGDGGAILPPTSLEASIILSIGIHCLLDIPKKGKGGYACIVFRKKRLNNKQTRIWLLTNGLLSILIFGGSVYWN